MTHPHYGIALHESGVRTTIEWLCRAEAAGVPAAWLTSGSAEPTAIFAAAAVQTSRIRMGTAVIQTWLRHPLVLAQQAAAIASLAPGRFVLGVGPSHAPMMEGVYGVDFHHPLRETREYLEILRQALGDGRVDFEGTFFRIHAPSTPRADVPIMVSALREASFALAGSHADAAIAWICPAPHLANRARPAMEQAAAAAGRPVPRLIAHTFLCVCDDAEAVRADARQRLAMYPRLPFYARMLGEAGIATDGAATDALIDAVVVYGDEAGCIRKLREFRAAATGDEVICSLMAVGADRAEGLSAGLRVVAAANQD